MENREIVYKNVNDLIPYARNSRTHDTNQVSQIVASIKEFGFTNPILIDDEGLIIAGHGRVQAAQKLNLKTVPTICLDYLTEAQKKAYVIADNRLALNAGWDFDMLKVELNDLNDLDFDVSLLGFDDKEINDILADPTEGLVDEDSTPDLVEDPITVEGDIWLLGNHRLMCGDSTSIDAVDKLMDGNKADMVFTDPPYNADYSSRVDKKRRKPWGGIKNDNMSADDFDVFLEDINSVLWSSCSDGASIYECIDWKRYPQIQKVFDDAFTHKAMIVWNKNCFGLGTYYRTKHELILFGCKGDTINTWNANHDEMDVWDISRDSAASYNHPTQKPVAIPERAIKNSSNPKNKVLDLFGGSGSTLLACEKLDRSAYLMELDPKYCDVIIQRWQKFTGQNAVHLDSNKTYNELINDINDG